jgi:hypothetical protein
LKLTIKHGGPLKESDSSNEGEGSNGEEPEQDRSPESKHEGTGTDVLASSFTHETTEDKKTGPTAETERVSSESPILATELADIENDSVNRGEKDNDRFTQSSNQDKRTDDESKNRGEKDDIRL